MDGATVSQAITYCDNVIDDPAGDHETARTIADIMNSAITVPAGMIPLDTYNIAYSPGLDSSQPPEQWGLEQNYPNPFNPNTLISYDVPIGGGVVSLHIYDVRGRLVKTLADGRETAGRKTVMWDATDDRGQTVSTGIYFYQLIADGFSQTRKMVLMK